MKALALVDAPDHVCCRYRVRAFGPALDRSGIDLSVEGLASGLWSRLRQVRRASAFDVVLLQRKLLANWQLAILRRHARRLVFDFDDAVHQRDSNDPRGMPDPRRAARFSAIARAADALIAGNDHLAGLARSAGAGGKVAIIPTCVEPRLYRRSEGSGRAGGIDLVWVGSSSTLRGLERDSAIFDRLSREVPGLRLRLIADRSTTLGSLPIDFIPWSEATESEAIASADVGIAMVPDDAWSRGKCGLKVLQYQAAALPVVANPVGVQARMIEPGRTGFLAKSADDWVSAIEALARDPALRRSLGEAGRVSVESNYSVDVWASRFVAALSGVASRTPRSRELAGSTRGSGGGR